MNRLRWAIPVVAAMIALGSALHRASAQIETLPPPGPEGGGFPQFPGPGFQAPDPSGAQLAASGNDVFILTGTTILRVDAMSLAIRSKAELPLPGPRGPRIPASRTGGQKADPALVEAGRAVLNSHGCLKCHTIEGQGGNRAPDLSQIGAGPQHTPDWLAAYVKDPTQVDPNSRMPPFDGRITDKDLLALGNYLASLK